MGQKEHDLKKGEPAAKEREPDQRDDRQPEAFSVPYTTADAVRDAEKQFANYLPNIIESHGGAVLDMQRSHTGDFIEDGGDDVVIYFSLASAEGGNALVGQGLALYENTGSGVRVFAGFESDYPFVFESILKGRIWVNKLEWAPGDGSCCPSIKTPHGLTIRGRKVY